MSLAHLYLSFNQHEGMKLMISFLSGPNNDHVRPHRLSKPTQSASPDASFAFLLPLICAWDCRIPLYAIASLVSLHSLEAAQWIDAVRDLYEAFVIYTFLFVPLSPTSLPYLHLSSFGSLQGPGVTGRCWCFRPRLELILNLGIFSPPSLFWISTLLIAYLGGERYIPFHLQLDIPISAQNHSIEPCFRPFFSQIALDPPAWPSADASRLPGVNLHY